MAKYIEFGNIITLCPIAMLSVPFLMMRIHVLRGEPIRVVFFGGFSSVNYQPRHAPATDSLVNVASRKEGFLKTIEKNSVMLFKSHEARFWQRLKGMMVMRSAKSAQNASTGSASRNG